MHYIQFNPTYLLPREYHTSRRTAAQIVLPVRIFDEKEHYHPELHTSSSDAWKHGHFRQTNILMILRLAQVVMLIGASVFAIIISNMSQIVASLQVPSLTLPQAQSCLLLLVRSTTLEGFARSTRTFIGWAKTSMQQ